ncbi:DUF2254 family protein [Mycolicibacterium doricum]|uniref:DUF2254 family protein n=1 Tax=Mycolicibacterium doricum TaxID=126673 RepID=UPI0035582C0B
MGRGARPCTSTVRSARSHPSPAPFPGDAFPAPTPSRGFVWIRCRRVPVSIEHDAALGFRQLTDIAVKAISPGINDPVTAVHWVEHMA